MAVERKTVWVVENEAGRELLEERCWLVGLPSMGQSKLSLVRRGTLASVPRIN